MRWRGGRESDNVEDRRGMPGGPMVVTGGLGTLVIVIIALLLGVDPQALFNPQGGPQPPGPAAGPGVAGPEDDLTKFVRVVLAQTEDVWRRELPAQAGRRYHDPVLTLFNGRVSSACGFASDAVGPFYCPPDRHVYLDLSFFRQLQQRFHAPGEFAQAYVIAHEIGHHVQNQLGISDRVQAQRARGGRPEANALSVRMELQADFLAGVWAHHADQRWRILEPGDVESALRAASAIGDDKLQMQSRGYVVPDSFTHGTSEQRVRWFRRGLESGRIADGDTFSAAEL